MPFLLFLKFI